jgi:hypothetical protein
MAQKQTEIDITDKHEIVLLLGINQARRTILARLDPPGGYNTIYWENEDLRDRYHKSVEAFLFSEEIQIKTILMKGQKPSTISPKAPPPPKLHLLQGDLTPDYLDWLLKWDPLTFENILGVRRKVLKDGESYSEDPRENWRREDVVRNYTQPVPGKKGSEYLSTRFKQRDQIIARRATHITFTEKEILREGEKDPETGLPVEITVEPYKDVYSPEMLERMEKKGEIEVVWKRAGAASATARI